MVRRQNPPDAFKKFWKSYLEHPSGVDHDVIIVWKNFIGLDHPNVSAEANVRHLVVSDHGCDIDVYFQVSKIFDYDAFVFLNSWSEINKDGWLKTMCDAMGEAVGLVGAFSSLESHRTNFVNGFWKVWREASLREKFLLLIYACYLWLRLEIHIPVHPNFHVRTNGFMISKKVLEQIRKPVIFDKIDAWKFESGDHSLTRQVRSRGYEVVSLSESKLIVDNRVRSR